MISVGETQLDGMLNERDDVLVVVDAGAFVGVSGEVAASAAAATVVGTQNGVAKGVEEGSKHAVVRVEGLY